MAPLGNQIIQALEMTRKLGSKETENGRYEYSNNLIEKKLAERFGGQICFTAPSDGHRAGNTGA